MVSDRPTTPTVVRTERGLTLVGTRITVYDIMDYVTAGWPPKLIRDRLNLTDEQIDGAMDYIDANRTEVETDYLSVLETAQEIRDYWEERNRGQVARISALPPKPGQEALRAKLRAWKERLRSIP